MHITIHKSKPPACSLVVETGNKQINKCLGTKHREGQEEELVVSRRHEGMVFKSRGLQLEQEPPMQTQPVEQEQRGEGVGD